jgi:hypothetical protein
MDRDRGADEYTGLVPTNISIIEVPLLFAGNNFHKKHDGPDR